PHPRSLYPTPFPYTTLFRSAAHRPVAHHASKRHRCGVTGPFHRLCHIATLARTDHQGHNDRVLWSVYYHVRLGGGHHWAHLRARDRKSTRLNSSHVSISYAV